MKREVAIDAIIFGPNVIGVYATPDAVTVLVEFGTIAPVPEFNNMYRLTVDKRFDFEEVVKYVKSYGMGNE
jgi:hypothetical protein